MNCVTDLELYKIDYAHSNACLGIIGIQLLSNTKNLYNGMEYLVRCYKDGMKFFEMALRKIFITLIFNIAEKPLFIDLYQSTLAYIFGSNTSVFYAMNVGGVLPNGIKIGQYWKEKDKKHLNLMKFAFEFDIKDFNITKENCKGFN